MTDFVVRARRALEQASERVRQKYGLTCAAAVNQLRRIEIRAEAFDPNTTVRLVAFHSGSSER